MVPATGGEQSATGGERAFMAEALRWLALGYSVPVTPSKNRVFIWRKLKDYGSEYFKQGVALLPYNRTSFTRFKYLSGKIREMGGEASIVEMKFLDPADEKEIVAKFRAQALAELDAILQDCSRVLSELSRHSGVLSSLQQDDLIKMVKRYSKAKTRNHFCLTLAQDIETGLYAIISLLKNSAGDFSAQLLKALEKGIS